MIWGNSLVVGDCTGGGQVGSGQLDTGAGQSTGDHCPGQTHHDAVCSTVSAHVSLHIGDSTK